MKNLLLFVLLLFYLSNFIEAQQLPTYGGIPGPENVLVVYKVQSGPTDTLGAVSDLVKEYYRLARSIPAENIVGLSLPSDTTITYQGVTHSINLDQQGEIIRDMNNKDIPDPTIHAWLYFNKRIA